MKSYLFYDIETSGLNKAFDQVLRFAAIRTDMRFQEVDRHTISVRLRPDIICSPDALIVNRISVSDSQTGICEYEATRQIHRLLNEPGTTSVGYNSLGFDDEFLRFSFHRNLLPPYTHQYDKGCSRMDMLPIATVYSLYRRGVLAWPEDQGRASLKLEHLSEANQLASGTAHEAIVDVEATVELARRLSQEEEMWNYLVGCFNKGIDRSRMENLPPAYPQQGTPYLMGLMVDSSFGPKLSYQAPVLYIGDSIPYSNQTLWLRLDTPELRDTTPDTIPDTTWVIRKKLGEPEILLPPKERYLKNIEEDRRKLCDENLKWLPDHPDLFGNIIGYHVSYTYPPVPDLDTDAALYEMGFLSRKEQEVCRSFHDQPPSEMSGFVDRFANPISKELATRIIGRNYPEYADRSVSKSMKRYMDRVSPKREEDAMLDYRGERRRTPAAALAEISEVRGEADLDPDRISLLDALERYLTTTFIPTLH